MPALDEGFMLEDDTLVEDGATLEDVPVDMGMTLEDSLAEEGLMVLEEEVPRLEDEIPVDAGVTLEDGVTDELGLAREVGFSPDDNGASAQEDEDD